MRRRGGEEKQETRTRGDGKKLVRNIKVMRSGGR